jgi:NADH-quinone oxidoreductase subunit N
MLNYQINTLLPEIIIFCSAILLLTYGAFSKNRSFVKVNLLTIFTLLLSATSLIFINSETTAFNNSFVNNNLTVHVKLFVLIIAVVVVYISSSYLNQNKLNLFEYPILLLFSILGMLVMISSNDLIMLYISIELQSLALYVLVALKKSSLRASEAALKYFILGSIASAIILYGASMIYAITGETNYDLIKVFGQGLGNNMIFSLGIVLILSGIVFKLSAAPFHMWTPDVYEGAPTSITTVLITLPKVAALTVLIHLLVKPFLYQMEAWQPILIIISILSMLIGSISALRQDNLKRLFAYSTIANIGYVMIGLVSASDKAIETAILYMLIYTISSLGVFSFILLIRREDTQLANVSNISGIAKTNPIIAFSMVILLLSMAGIPPFAGFFTKLYVFTYAVEQGFLYLAIIAIIFSVVSAYYYLKIIKTMYLDDNNDELTSNLDKKQSLVLVTSALIMFLFVFYGDNLIKVINNFYV